MKGAERGFLLLSGTLGDPRRKPLTVSQLRILASRVQESKRPLQDRELTSEDLISLGYTEEMAYRILQLLSDDAVLDSYLERGEKDGCYPISRASHAYPEVLHQKFALDCPGCLWAKGDASFLAMPKIALVGSRDISPANRAFAWEVGVQAAKQGYVLVSGNARGADRIAQSACLRSGGRVICVVADELFNKTQNDQILYLSESDYDESFSAQRAISRNRVIHALGDKTFVAQSAYRTGGTWDGTVKNLQHGWSPVFCMDDGSKASIELQQMGATGVTVADLQQIDDLQPATISFF